MPSSIGYALLLQALTLDATEAKAVVDGYLTVPTEFDLWILFMFHFVINI